MTRAASYRHAFADTFPSNPEPDVLYVSLKFATTMHLCMCGCGHEIVAPLDPTDWTAHFDGTVSLTPSIGNWSLPCQSHYVLIRGKVRWARQWTQSQIDAGRERDRITKQRTYGQGDQESAPSEDHMQDRDAKRMDRWDKWW